MTLTPLDPIVALIVVDLQKGVVGIPAAHAMSDVLARAGELTTAFRAAGLPVVLVNVDGGAPGRTESPRLSFERPADWTELVPELDPQPSDHRVTKRTWGAFHGTDLDAYLREVGVTQVVVIGVATTAGVESTARAAHEHGYHVVLATDAMTDRSLEGHQGSVERIFPRLGVTATTAEIIALLPS